MMDSKIQTQSKRIVLLNNTLKREQAVSDSLSSVVVLSNKAKTDLSRAYDFQTDQTDALKRTIVTMKRKHNAFKGLAITTFTATILGLLLIK